MRSFKARSPQCFMKFVCWRVNRDLSLEDSFFKGQEVYDEYTVGLLDLILASKFDDHFIMNLCSFYDNF